VTLWILEVEKSTRPETADANWKRYFSGAETIGDIHNAQVKKPLRGRLLPSRGIAPMSIVIFAGLIFLLEQEKTLPGLPFLIGVFTGS
jgi:hypothetical protein